jgi:hypothetical protein
MEDMRTRHPLMRVPPVDISPQLQSLAAAGQMYLDGLEAAMLKVQESGLTEDQKAKLLEGNARLMFSRKTA